MIYRSEVRLTLESLQVGMQKCKSGHDETTGGTVGAFRSVAGNLPEFPENVQLSAVSSGDGKPL